MLKHRLEGSQLPIHEQQHHAAMEAKEAALSGALWVYEMHLSGKRRQW